jgi:PAS domain S-box-containing protein
MVNRYSLFSLSFLIVLGVAFWIANSSLWAIVCLLLSSFFCLVFSFSFYRKVRQLSEIHFPKKKLRSFITLQHLSDTVHESERKFQLIAEAVENIGNEKATKSFQLEGIVGTAIERLQERLYTLKEEEARRTWAVQGLALLGEIRKNQENLTEYSFQVISQLVKYVNANQGTFYILEGEQEKDRTLRLLATYAYGKRKFHHEEIIVDEGEGLIGQCIVGKEMIFMTEVPKDYIKITSGLGEASPRCIVILPMVFKGKAYGVIEMASFEILEQYQLDFLVKVSEGIASEISGIRNHDHTKKLLESSQTLASELRGQEEEMRQTMEELSATQEEMARKMKELEKLQRVELERKKNEAILNGCMDGVVSFNHLGKIEFINAAAQEIFGRSHKELIGHEISKLLPVRIATTSSGEMGVISKTGNEVKIRTEVTGADVKGEEIAMLLTATKVDLEGSNLYTLFIQKISVDIF